jgi:hypothetical protein
VAAFAEELDGFSGLRDEVVRLRETAKRSSKLSDLFTQDPSRHRELQVRTNGDYNAWPGPNSNTFVQAVLDAVPELKTVLPPTAIGKDYPYRGEWFGLTPSGTGAYASLGGYLGLTIGWVEGLEVNFLGAVLGLDIRRPALKLPGIGRLGMTAGI